MSSVPNVFHLVCEQNGWPVAGGAAVVPLSADRQQTVHHDEVEDAGEELLRVYTVIGDAAALDEVRLRAALSINSRLRHGAIAILDDRMVLTDTFLLDHADAAEVFASVRYLAETADKYERLIYGGDAH